MKNVLAVMVVLFGCAMVQAADQPTPATGAEQSVLATNSTTATAATVAAAPNCNNCVGVVECRRCRLYNVEETCNESCRNRVFGGYVKKQTVRKVYRPVR